MTANLAAQTGSITGSVLLNLPGQPGDVAIGAVISVDNANIGTQSDVDGKFKLRISPGTYSLTCRYIGCKTTHIPNVIVSAGKECTIDISLTPVSDTTKQIVIIDFRNSGSTTTLLDSAKNADNAQDVKGADDIKKTNAQTATDVARTMPGVTVVDNRFVVVRGLSERFNAVLLNNVLAPSSETDVKAFSFDLVPSGMIDNFIIYKTSAADLPGEFAGGAIRINTIDIPTENRLIINYTSGYRSETTFNPFTETKTKGHTFASGANSLALPGSLPSNLATVSDPAAVQANGQLLQNNWAHSSFNAPVDNRFSMTWNYRLDRRGIRANRPGYRLGNSTAINYSNTYQSMTSHRLDYNTYDAGTNISDTIFSYEDRISRHAVRLAFVQNNAIVFGHASNHRITLKNIFNQLADNEATLRTGRNMEESNFHQQYSYRYSQRAMYSGQLGGQHKFNNNNTKADWTFGYSLSKRTDPDWRRARYTRDFAAAESEPFYVYVASQPQPFFLGRIFMNVNENIMAGSGNFSHVFFIKDKNKAPKQLLTVKTGFYYENKTREFQVRNIGYRAASMQTYANQELLTTPLDQIFSPENINSTNGLALGEKTSKSDQYSGANRLIAGYLMTTIPLGKFTGKKDEEIHVRVRLSAGIRFEHNIQQLHSNKTNSSDTLIVRNEVLSALPSINTALNLTERSLIRFAYGRTINRPEFREIAPLYFYDFIFNSINTGNDSLKNATVDNFDLRWEFYPRSGENITFGIFYKKFTNPIEVYFIPGGGSGGTRSFTWGNATAANSYGAEIEIRKRFDSFTTPFIRNCGLVGNAAYIRSVIDLDTISTSTRPMMGQSPWIVNAGFFYQDTSIRLQFTANYNIIGPRVVIVGVPGIPEVYEMPRHQLDLSIVKTFGRNDNIDARLMISDVLNQETLLVQDANNDGQIDSSDQRMQSFKRGIYFQLGLTVKLSGNK
ncbi:MAG TPA: carboxypeptidase regulatory-like domain-containing protein [Bacteroidia bacterium]|nr:carboxypeptidase regulatory-like domain-containing protein [Bacteroidia bacterium]